MSHPGSVVTHLCDAIAVCGEPAAPTTGSSVVITWIVANFSCAPRLDRTGHLIDYVFASNDLVVRRWEVVVSFDPRTLDVVGTLASDHDLVVATLELP